MTTSTAIALSLEVDCPASEECRAFAEPLLAQLSDGYDECSVLDLRIGADEWAEAHRTARRRASRSARLGYLFSAFNRERYVDDIFAINTSLAVRQGRPMTAGYRERPSDTPDPDWPCQRHRVTAYGVFLNDGRFPLVAYAFVYRAGDLALVSQILGHGDHLEADVMFLLARGVVEAEAGDGGFLVYNRHDSGTPGLRFHKERIGFEPREVAWIA